MEAKIANLVIDDRLLKTPEEDRYGQYDLEKNFARNGQIMVTITLKEYRDLLTASAKAEATEANSKRFVIERERDELKRQVIELQKQLDSLRAVIASAVPVKAADPDNA